MNGIDSLKVGQSDQPPAGSSQSERVFLFPFAPQHLQHKHGGRITRLEKIAHECYPPEDGRSRDTWFFIGDVQWRDGGSSKGLEIAPWALCADMDNADAQAEINGVLAALSDYLRQHGKWSHDSKTRSGWYAHVRPKGEANPRRGRPS